MGALQLSSIKKDHMHKEFCSDVYRKYSDMIDQDPKKEISVQKERIKSKDSSSLTENHRETTFSESIFIFDWDDTLMCTTYLAPLGTFDEQDMKLSETQMENIRVLDESAFKLLFSTIFLGDTYVVTNATTSRVNYSAERFYPKVNSLLKNIKILSARDLYEKSFPSNNNKWKILTFLDIRRKYYSGTDINIICIGDSNIEMQAANALAAEFKSSYLKTIKFRESPKLEELIKQINLVVNNLKKIYEEKKNVIITVEKKNKNEKEVIKVI